MPKASTFSAFSSVAPCLRGGFRRGFTLIEILVVTGIIVLVAVLAVPAFNVMTGSRSIEAATGTVSAMLGRVRTEALFRQHPVGLAVFNDATRQRTTLAIVAFAGDTPWAAGVRYERGDLVYVDEVVGSGASATPVRNYFLCYQPHLSDPNVADDAAPSVTTYLSSPRWAIAHDPATSAATVNRPNQPDTTATPNRRYPMDRYVSVIPGTEMISLPPGIAGQVLNNARTTAAGTGAATDRYVSAGILFFGGDGKLLAGPESQWGTLYNPADDATNNPLTTTALRSTRLGLMIQFNKDYTSGATTNLDPGVTNGLTPPTFIRGATTDLLTGGLGVMLYDRAAYAAQSFPRFDAQTRGEAFTAVPGNAESSKTYQEADDWLDANGTLLLINRFNGTLLRTQ